MKKVLLLIAIVSLVLSSCATVEPTTLPTLTKESTQTEIPATTSIETSTARTEETPSITTTETKPTTTIEPVVLTSIAIEPSKPDVLKAGTTQQFKATGTYSDGTTRDITSEVKWKSDAETLAVINNTGLVSAVAKKSSPTTTSIVPPEVMVPSSSLTAFAGITATLSGITSRGVILEVEKAPLKDLPSLDAFMKGIHFCDWNPSDSPWYPMYSVGTDLSLQDLADTGANWISLLVNGSQETPASTTVSRNLPGTATDAELLHVVKLAHNLGIRVVLSPTLYHGDEGSWNKIGTAFTSETQWQDWFASYREFINHYASFAQESGIDMMYVGSELCGTTQREADWRRVVKEVRERYKGPIGYDSVWWGSPTGEYKRIKWWDAVDYIAVDFGPSLTNKNDPTVAELKESWARTGYLTELDNISKRFNKPVIVSEIGYQSNDGTARIPWDFTNSRQGTVDYQEQADCYQAAFEMLWGKPWLKGIFWWQWSATGAPWRETPQGKPAEEIIKHYYLSQ